MRTELDAARERRVRRRANILGVGVDAIDEHRAVETIDAALRTGEGGYVCVTGVHGVMEAQRDPALKRILNGALLTTPDGMPTVWVGRASGFHEIDRVYGPDLMLAVCRQLVGTGRSHFFLGGSEGVAQELGRCLSVRFPGLRVAGSYTPPFRPLTGDEEEELVQLVRQSEADIVWVGLSTPKQERLMAQLADRIAPAVMVGVGAAFDFHTGRVRQAPRWMQRSGFEWLFRMLQEPRRLFPRYARNNLPFIAGILLQGLGIKRYTLES